MVDDDLALATLIGDIVASKRHFARRELQRAVTSVLSQVNEWLKPSQQLKPTVGDEFQGGFATVADAALASLLIRLSLLTGGAEVDSRYGLGWGDVTVFDDQATPTSQDGPGWWSARDAIDRVKQLGARPRTSFARTWFALPPGTTEDRRSQATALDAFLLTRDAAVGQMTGRQQRLLLGLLLGRTQDELAVEEGVTQGAVSQALRRTGALAIEAAHERLHQGPT